MKATRYRSPRSPAELGLFLANEDVGHWCEAIPGGWRLIGLASSGRPRDVDVDVTADLVTGEPRCTCRARRLPCKHVRVLSAVGLLGGVAALTPGS